MRALGIVLVLSGLVALVWGGFSYTKHEKVIDLGPIEATARERERVDIPPIAGALAVAAGAMMIFAGRRRETV